MMQAHSLITDLANSLAELTDQQDQLTKQLIDQLITEAELHQSHSWAAQMTPLIEQPALLGQLLASHHNGNLLSAQLYPHLAKIEAELLAWLGQVFQLPFAHFTHGGSYSNLEALWQAREQSSNSSQIVYGSQAAHYSISKACQILGLIFKPIPTDHYGVMLIDQLTQACQLHPPVAIVATAGSSGCGAIDSISCCIKLAKHYGCWCHVDAAWGGALMFTEKATLLSDLQQADSVSFDPHKALAQPRPCGVLLYQQPLATLADIDYLASPPKQTLLGSYGGELFLPLWCSVLGSGKTRLLNQLKHRLAEAELFYSLLQQKTDWWLHHSATGIVCFKPSSAVNLSVLIKQGKISSCQIKQNQVYRAVFSSHHTSASQLIAELEHYL